MPLVSQVPGVQSVFDLHVWALKPSIPLLAAHVTVDADADAGRVLADVTSVCRRQGITHTTIQARLWRLRCDMASMRMRGHFRRRSGDTCLHQPRDA